MRFVDRNGREITTIDDWGLLGRPAAEHHWRPKRSAYELARAWIDGDAETRATELLRRRPELAGAELHLGIAEKKTFFDEIRSGPRNHDLLVQAACDRGTLVVGVEGKADEPFDKQLDQWLGAAQARSANTRAPQRLDNLTTHFFGTTMAADTDSPPLSSLGYQLLSALAGTLADAKDAAVAVLLIHEFRTDLTDDELHDANAKALDGFLDRLSNVPIDRTGPDDAWITGPITVRGDGTHLPSEKDVHVAKLVTNTRNRA
jgi:hypothetical protein